MNYRKVYLDLIQNSKRCNRQGYLEKHHILPKSLGGTDEQDNIANLTPREHFIAHYLLCKIYPDEPKMAFALWFMSQKNSCSTLQRKYKVTSRIYSYARESFYRFRDGYVHSDETKQKMLGRKCTEEQNKLNSEIQKGLIKKEEAVGQKRSKRLKSWLPHWTNGLVEMRSKNSPGLDWKKGRLSKGVTWWNNGETCKMQKESPGPGYIKGRLYSRKKA